MFLSHSREGKSHLTTSNKLLIYKAILKPVCTNGIQLWGTASTSNIEILERFQSETLRMIVDASFPIPELEDYPFSAAHGCIFSIFQLPSISGGCVLLPQPEYAPRHGDSGPP
jgi:hypothetical protein